jgi:DNA polymerase-3 subunit delta
MAKKADTIIHYKQLLTELKARKFKPIYFLMGAESYFIERIADYIEANALTEGERSFNQMIMYGKEVTPSQITAACRRFPMMSEFQVIIVKEAQNLKELDPFISYFENPSPTTILVVCWMSDKMDKRTKFYKSLKADYVFESEGLYDSKIPEWIAAYISEKGMTISPKAIQLIADHLGNDLGKIANEIEKLLINKKGEKEISETDIEQNIGISKDYNIFELQNAIAHKNFTKAIRIADYFAGDPTKNSIIPVIANLYSLFSKIYMAQHETDKSKNNLMSKLGLNFYAVDDILSGMKNYHPSRVEMIMKLLLEYDLKSKGVNDAGTSDYSLSKELFYKMMH